MHNPSTVPNDRRVYSGADLICVFESPYPEYASASTKLPRDDLNGYERQNYAYMVSGVPTNWLEYQLGNFIDTIKSSAQYLFITDVNIEQQDIYASFGTIWEEFVRKIALLPAKSITAK